MRVLRVSIFTLLFAFTGHIANYTISSTRAFESQAQVLAATQEVGSATDSAILDKINKVRVESGVKELDYSSAMKNLTTTRVTDMATKQYYSHTSPTGIKFGDIIKDYDPTSGNSCENLQLQVGDDWQSAVDAWVKSPAHYRCLTKPELTRGAGNGTAYEDVSYAGSGSPKQMFVFSFIATN